MLSGVSMKKLGQITPPRLNISDIKLEQLLLLFITTTPSTRIISQLCKYGRLLQ
jgi:hypothetical protein